MSDYLASFWRMRRFNFPDYEGGAHEYDKIDFTSTYAVYPKFCFVIGQFEMWEDQFEPT